MAQGRIKFTGYMNLIDLDPEDIDMDDPTGLSESGYNKLTGHGDTVPKLSDLEDLSTELNG